MREEIGSPACSGAKLWCRIIQNVRYFVQHTAGTGELIAEALRHQLQNMVIEYRDESSICFRSKASIGEIAAIPYVKNAFTVIAATPRQNLEKSVARLARSVPAERFPDLPSKTKNFRTMFHIDGELRSLDQSARRSLEQAIAKKTSGRVEPRGLCQEYWVIGRSESNELILAARLPKQKRPPKGKGAISYELSAVLVGASNPRHDDVFLDPFAGSGSFVLARLDSPARRIWYSDVDRTLRKALPGEIRSDKRVGLLDDDGLKLPSFEDGEVDVIVTDPPWGEHEDVGMPYSEFAEGIATSFDRVLHARRGRFVLLSARRVADTLRTAFEDAGFAIAAQHGILVNGHPATVLVGDRRDSTPGERS